MIEEKDERNFCCVCDAVVELSPDHQVLDQSNNHRKVVVDNRRCHILLHGAQRLAALRKVDARAPISEIVAIYNPSAVDAPVEAEVLAPQPEGDNWFDELMSEEGVA
jgi:hypothetical protein